MLLNVQRNFSFHFMSPFDGSDEVCMVCPLWWMNKMQGNLPQIRVDVNIQTCLPTDALQLCFYKAGEHCSIRSCLDFPAWFIWWRDTQSASARVKKNSVMELCETSSFSLWPHKAFKRTRQKSSRPPSCSQRQWLTGTNNPPYCLLYIEFGVHHGTPWISLTVYCPCVYVCQSIYSLLTALQGLCWGTANVTLFHSVGRMCLSKKSSAYQNDIVLNMQCCVCMLFATIFSSDSWQGNK